MLFVGLVGKVSNEVVLTVYYILNITI